ncbi:MAG TPA: ATP-dependent DNA helicase RecG [Microscillaceae bacterium]|jgi:ATP-dependent DNA helicase RecG|nr:ATP-dependent DNA helicase RecG [Microscillaceae bacterium]
MSDFWETSVSYLKGVGPARAALLNKELHIFTYADLIHYYPFRHEDRSRIENIAHLKKNWAGDDEMPPVQLKGRLLQGRIVGEGNKQRLVALFTDGSGDMELLWFQGIQWVHKNLKWGETYLIYGKAQLFQERLSMVHPDAEWFDPANPPVLGLQPVYSLTETLKKKFLNTKALSKIQKELLKIAEPHITETLPPYLLEKNHLTSKKEALKHIHLPQSHEMLEQAKRRLKFEELFFIQLQLLKLKQFKKSYHQGYVCKETALVKNFYNHHLPFELTNAQKKVLREVYADMCNGRQMNRLLQGDVGSGKTMVAFVAMLFAVGNGLQACMMAPTEILAEQHFKGLQPYAEKLGITIDLLTGSTKNLARRVMLGRLENGNLKILIGTHALIEEVVQFERLGLCVIDEQHRFGVEQRSKLWKKTADIFPHVLVMTATPIPRTLAMTLYGDLDVSVLDELPAGRKPIRTAHRTESQRLKVYQFIRDEITAGRQAYIVYPLIEESEKLDYKNLMDGAASVKQAFPDLNISVVHGKISAAEKDYEMQRFKRRETEIMVATTVIEVGVDVPNASVMLIENAEKFGLAQLHQLRGRVGRGAEQSYCILMTGLKVSKEGRIRIETMVRTTNGFEIADVDLNLRGPGNLMGKEQSGLMNLLIADLAQDSGLLQLARQYATDIIEKDPNLLLPQHKVLQIQLNHKNKENQWSRIS